ncbi:MAG: TRAP transporter large permease [Qingshengfaniella sp.]
MVPALIALTLFGGLLLSVPIFVTLAGTAFVTLGLTSPIPLSVLAQRIYAGLDSFTLLASPFYFLAAEIMSRSGLSQRLVNFVQTLVGHLPGGLGISVVLTCMLFGTITGSSASTIVAIGSIMAPALIRAGYSQGFAIGSVTCSALIGMIIPPSNAMIIYGATASTSIGALFMAGIGAGGVFALAYCLYCVGYARLTGVPRAQRATLRQIASAGRAVIWGIGLPVLILGGIYSGAFTTTEAAIVAVLYAAAVALIVYRTITLRQMFGICVDAGIASARVLILVAAASVFSWLMTVTQTTQLAARPLANLADSPALFMLATNAVMLLAGMFVDVYSNILVLVPVLLQPATLAGIDPVHLGIIATVNVDIGNVTPPFGLNLFVAAALFRCSYFQVLRAILPWLCVALASLLVISFVPEISMWLPRRLYPGL